MRILVIGRRFLFRAVFAASVLLLMLSAIFIYFISLPAATFIDPGSSIIVIDAGHGGVDGGANRDGILEKDINLDVAKKLKALLENDGYIVSMTREEDVSLDGLVNKSSTGRHRRDLTARVNMINNSSAQLFISIHVNYYPKNPSASGSFVFFNKKYEQNKTLALCIQNALNELAPKNKRKSTNTPQHGKYYLLGYSKVPGVIVETAFLSNANERTLLQTESFRAQLAAAISKGAKQYLALQKGNDDIDE